MPATKFQWNGSMLLGQARLITIMRTQRSVTLHVHFLSRSLFPVSDTVPPISSSSILLPSWCLVGSRNHEIPPYATCSSLLVKTTLIWFINLDLTVYTLLARMVRKGNKDRTLACRLRILCRNARQTHILIERHCLLPHFVAVWHNREHVFTDFDGHCVRAALYRFWLT